MTREDSEVLYRVIGLLTKARKSGNGWEARCPTSRHRRGDKDPSLSVGIGYDGRVLLNCKGGCPTEEVVTALGLSMADLFEKSKSGSQLKRYRLVGKSGTIEAFHVREELPGDKKLWWESHGKRGLNGTAVESLPLYRIPEVEKAPTNRPVILTEGEKAAEALADIGLLAVATVTGAGGTPSKEVLEPLQGHEVWLWPDNDEPGREHMQRISRCIVPSPKWIVWPSAPEKGDAADYVAQGGTAGGVAALVMAEQRAASSQGPRIWRGSELEAARFEPIRWAIPRLLPAGLTILAGRPKLGKSWLVLGWCLDVATGRPVLRVINVEQGDVLYLALEDSERRMQERQALMLGDTKGPYAFQVVTSWPRMDEGGLDLLEQWIDNNARARLIAIDTFKRFRPREEQRRARLYDLDYDALAPVAELAQRRNVAIVLVFHTNKSDPADPIDLVSGTLGLSGAADGVLVMKRERGQADASLFVTGRDVEEQDLALKWESDDELGWRLLGNADQFRQSRERQQIIDVIASVPGMRPSEIAAALGKGSGPVRRLLFSMVHDGQVRVRDGCYWPSLDTIGNSGNAANAEDAQGAFRSQIRVQNGLSGVTDPLDPIGNSGNAPSTESVPASQSRYPVTVTDVTALPLLPGEESKERLRHAHETEADTGRSDRGNLEGTEDRGGQARDDVGPAGGPDPSGVARRAIPEADRAGVDQTRCAGCGQPGGVMIGQYRLHADCSVRLP